MKFGYWVWGLGFGIVLVGCAPEAPVPTKLPDARKGHALVAEPVKLAIPFYPDAKVVQSSSHDRTAAVNLQTDAGPDKVAAFYRKQLGVAPRRDGPLTTFDVTKGGVQYAIVITTADKKTSISILGEKR